MITGYVPCFNDVETVVTAAESLKEQTQHVDEVFVVDDGSTDASAEVAADVGIDVLQLGANLGRGAARARAMKEARGEFVICCDATMKLAADFMDRMLPHFKDAKVAAAFGRVIDQNPRGVSGRWRERHLFKSRERTKIESRAGFATWGAVVRKSAVMEVGNFDAKLRHSEDAELGARLLKAGYDVKFVPDAEVYPQTQNTVGEALERYWRWNVGPSEEFGAARYLRQLIYSASWMARRDLREGDVAGACLSLLTPHYFLWRKLR